MSVRKYLIAGLLTVAGAVFSADRASAQITLGAGGVQLGGGNGTGVVIPYSGGFRNATVVSPGGAWTPSTGTTYAPAYSTPYGGTSYYSPQTGSFYNPNVGTYSAPTTVYGNYPGTAYPSQNVYGQGVYGRSGYNRGYATPGYGGYQGTVVGPVVSGYRIR